MGSRPMPSATRLLTRLLVARPLAARAQHTTASNAELALVHGWPSEAPPGSKRLIFVRHAEGWHNKDARELPNYFKDGLGHTETYWDAKLTPEGENQALELAAKLQWRQTEGIPELVAVSPLTRVLQTASIAWPSTTGRKGEMPRPRFVATSLARERVWDHTCDKRRPRRVLEAEFPHVDFSELPDGDVDEMWEHKEDDVAGVRDPYTWNSTGTAARASRLLHWLWARPESSIGIVTHWVFLLHIFRPFPDEQLQKPFGNAEMRFVTLVPKGAEGAEGAAGGGDAEEGAARHGDEL